VKCCKEPCNNRSIRMPDFKRHLEWHNIRLQVASTFSQIQGSVPALLQSTTVSSAALHDLHHRLSSVESAIRHIHQPFVPPSWTPTSPVTSGNRGDPANSPRPLPPSSASAAFISANYSPNYASSVENLE